MRPHQTCQQFGFLAENGSALAGLLRCKQIGGISMFDWLCKLFLNAKARGAQLEILEQQAHIAKQQLNESLSLAVASTAPETKVSSLEFAKSKFAELQAIAAEHPRMRLKNEEEVDGAIKLMEAEFSRAGYYAMADASRRQSASAYVNFSQRAEELLRSR